MVPAVTSTCRRPGSHQSQPKPGSVRRGPSAAPISTHCSGSGAVPVSARDGRGDHQVRREEQVEPVVGGQAGGLPHLRHLRADPVRQAGVSGGGVSSSTPAHRVAHAVPCCVRRQGAGQRVLVGDDDVGPVVRHGPVDRALDEAVERNQVLVPQFPHRGHADLVERAVGALAGRIDRHARARPAGADRSRARTRPRRAPRRPAPRRWPPPARGGPRPERRRRGTGPRRYRGTH